jgi:hypothetical protein
MTETAVQNAYTGRTQRVVTLCVAVLAAGGAQAGAWEEFEQRCLVPMENVALGQPTDLRPHRQFKNDGDTYTDYAFEDGNHILSVSDGRAGRAQWCSVGIADETTEPSAEIANKFLAWSSRADVSQRYAEVASKPGALVLRSLEWREPRMDVTMLLLPSGPGIFLSAEETDLES